jgi:hypothetical protein
MRFVLTVFCGMKYCTVLYSKFSLECGIKMAKVNREGPKKRERISFWSVRVMIIYLTKVYLKYNCLISIEF